MPRFRVSAYDRRVRHLEKVFEANSEDEATELAEAEEYTPENGWEENYDELFSEQYIENVTEEEG